MADPQRAPGTLFLVVGPSGAGKDTVMLAARKRLPDTYVFPRRVITRPASAGGEDYVAETADTFARLEKAHQFALSWQAHHLLYGIPVSIERDLAEGRHVIINVSRTVVDAARAAYANVRVILITASHAVLEARLKARGREVPADIAERLAREEDIRADAVVVNEGSIESAADAFLAVLRD
jgi:ribose 1,5-bisphosphokinase